MNKKLLIFLAAAAIFLIGWLLIRMYLFRPGQQSINDLRPALLPVGSSAPLVAGKPADSRLKLPKNFQVTLFSTKTPGARDLEFSPNGTLLVSLRKDGKVLALPDKNNDGQVDETIEILKNLRNPHGLAFHNGKLFVAEETQITRYFWDENTLTATLDKKLFDAPSGVTLPGGGGGHQTRSMVFDQAGNLYVSIGSTCNVCDEKNEWNATVIITNENGDNPRIFAKGLRNAVFLTLNPLTDKVWVTEMGRDNLGDDVPPDEVNILQDNQHYGWPYCYDDQMYDKNFGRQSAEFCTSTIKPTFKLQAHSAPLGLTFVPELTTLPSELHGDLLVAYHGSWNRSVPTGYKVVRLHTEGDNITEQSDFLTGFVQGNQAIGRPVDVIFDQFGKLYVSDDKAGVIYLISTISTQSAL